MILLLIPLVAVCLVGAIAIGVAIDTARGERRPLEVEPPTDPPIHVRRIPRRNP